MVWHRWPRGKKILSLSLLASSKEPPVVALGFVLLVLAGLLGAGIALANRDPVEAEAFGVTLQNVSVGGLFLVGMAVGVAAMLGLGLMLLGAGRRRAKRVAVKREVRDVRGERESLAEENARLQAELERTQADAAHDTTSTAVVTPAAAPAGPSAPPTSAAARTVLPGEPGRRSGNDVESPDRRTR